jgi:hypothetical protein
MICRSPLGDTKGSFLWPSRSLTRSRLSLLFLHQHQIQPRSPSGTQRTPSNCRRTHRFNCWRGRARVPRRSLKIWVSRRSQLPRTWVKFPFLRLRPPNLKTGLLQQLRYQRWSDCGPELVERKSRHRRPGMVRLRILDSLFELIEVFVQLA